MEVGALTESVEVRGRAVAVDSETASIGQVITEKQVTELPLNGRNFLQLLFLGNGAVETDGEQGGMRQGAGNAISINGSRPTSNNYLLDGTSNTDTALGTPAAILSIDAIQEFKEQTATYSAEYGFSANQISIVSKTGTNRLSGSVFYVHPQRQARRAGASSTSAETEAGPEAIRVRGGWSGVHSRRLRRTEQDVLPGELRRLATGSRRHRTS